MNLRLTATFIALLAFSLSARAGNTHPKLRLSEVQRINPTGYNVELTLDPDKDAFAATIDIHLKVDQPTATLWLNAAGIAVQKASLVGSPQPAVVVPGGDDFLGLQFPAPLPAGSAEIRIEYTGKYQLKEQAGVFRTEDQGNHYLLTQFEQTDARRAFPCFDEPVYKVPWQVTLHVPEKDVAVSNTPIASERVDAGSKTYVFEQTKPLPSYLVAFGVGPFEFVKAGFAGKNHVPVRIVTPKGRSDEAKYAADVSATILTRLEDYFGVPYPYAKADLVAIPVSAGFAMENAGMVTYGQTSILAKPESDTEDRRRGYASIAAHELAHQWFGDLVTTSWWDDIWLNEAFATWMSSKLLAEWKPEWATRADDANRKFQAEQSDSLVSARKIRQEIESPGDINNAFDDITYLKGAAVIGMFENWMGADAFQSGVRSYMNRYAFRTATTNDFLNSLNQVSKKSVAEAFSTFLNQAGVPVLSVALDCGANKPKLHLEQNRFLPLGSKAMDRQLWQVPVCLKYDAGEGQQKSCILMTQARMDVPLQAEHCPAWVQANAGSHGYYHVSYEKTLSQKLTSGDGMATLSVSEKLDLIHDAQALSRSGAIPAADALEMVKVFRSDPERHVLESALNLATFPVDRLPPNLMPKLSAFVRANFQSRARELGWQPKPGESEEAWLLRPNLVSAVATIGEDRELTSQAQSLADQWLSTQHGVDATVVAGVLRTAAYHGDAALAERFVAAWNKLDAQQQIFLFRAMFNFRDPKALQILFEAALAGKVTNPPAAYLFFYAGSDYTVSRNERLQFLESHFEPLMELLGKAGFSAQDQMPRVGEGLCDAQKKEELVNFFNPRMDKLVGAPRILAQVTEGIDQCIAESAVEMPSLISFLEKQ